ncbi:MAG TPA: hypothetical protein VMW27_05290 [Thermoanaerobaculia bacterium]|nr:hypothetical protein [Thermoanaerobaculia bacterium]
MMRNLLLFVAGGAAVLIGRKYSREISRTVVRGAIQTNQTLRQITAEALNEAARENATVETEPVPPVRRIEAVHASSDTPATIPSGS